MTDDCAHRLPFRDAMARLPAAVCIVTTQGTAGRGGLTATAVCPVTDTPPTVLVCINRSSAMNPVFEQNGRMCINVLNHRQEAMARHFAGMTDLAMADRFLLDGWRQGEYGQPLLGGALASLEGEISQVQSLGTHQVYLLAVRAIWWEEEGDGLIYFKRRFHCLPCPVS
ncbi:4-hydroxyphenylacetate 3-monooxygenase, reductase component [Erwinia persicina]|uniref:4-hydroxyphenylacetate 3-monooxygenase, reductase component n=1 Tax=Erwinia persicina TaxID=55211 RepID=UPI00177CA346|nr:4-hydroxyphenylacetate 3-monooxygenase, reductase component [Erwinia persicina]MBD8165046.1 4-hydroxyphenylacetate 3-monooxygenase, reductase component [Erwinia persicina]MBD8216524.1 4-hydroxyphenylacetate 3-monooxygenase, reductase component [Erwinia persicina]